MLSLYYISNSEVAKQFIGTKTVYKHRRCLLTIDIEKCLLTYDLLELNFSAYFIILQNKACFLDMDRIHKTVFDEIYDFFHFSFY